ncbi:hypothetical protein [Streptomyces spectabilis]|uniref:ATP-dependent helicase n=1 Tax=Streptomyces spectabilis TaxID=68270 RepID=A0A7W8B3I1_STRST|nr:hypothetical protein [Streptomyces spectabilis]MBB5109699.1 hypothetical protein [Streptomyces spectabilis]
MEAATPVIPAPHSATAASGAPAAAQLRDLIGCAAVFVPCDPPRTGRVAFWRPDSTAPPQATGRLTVARAHGGAVRTREVEAAVVPVAQALQVLVEARRVPGAGPAAVFWGAAVLEALHLLARGRLLPGVSPGGFDAWRIGPYDAEDVARLRELAAAMPPEARAVPVEGQAGLDLPRAEPLVRAFFDAVADVMARTPAAPVAAGGDAWTAAAPQTVEQHRAWHVPGRGFTRLDSPNPHGCKSGG